jgi:hypothetical protein
MLLLWVQKSDPNFVCTVVTTPCKFTVLEKKAKKTGKVGRNRIKEGRIKGKL